MYMCVLFISYYRAVLRSAGAWMWHII